MPPRLPTLPRLLGYQLHDQVCGDRLTSGTDVANQYVNMKCMQSTASAFPNQRELGGWTSTPPVTMTSHEPGPEAHSRCQAAYPGWSVGP